MNSLKEQEHFLNLLVTTHPLQKRALIDTASSKQLHLLCESILNIISGDITLDKETKSRLYKNKDLLEDILKRSTPKRRKQILLRNNLSLLEIIIKHILKYFKEHESTS